MKHPRQPECVAIIPSQCVLGEGPVWDDRLGCLWFTDIQQATLLRWDQASDQLQRIVLPERLGSLALTPDPETLLAAFASGFALLNPANGSTQWLHRVEPANRGLRLNDGRVDRQGRFWAGSMVEDPRLAPPERGALYCLDGTAPAVIARTGIGISNSICFSPDGEYLYFADTPTRQILRYPCPPRGAATGLALGTASLFAQLPDGCFPDGSDVDADGQLWNAEWGGSRVTAYSPAGDVTARIALPVSQPTCVAFGGAAHDLLFITSASEGLDEAARAAQPHAGDVLVYRGDFRGLPAGRFATGQAASS